MFPSQVTFVDVVVVVVVVVVVLIHKNRCKAELTNVFGV